VINALEWSRNGHLVATAGGDGLVRLFDIRTFKELEPLKGHPKEVTCESCRGHVPSEKEPDVSEVVDSLLILYRFAAVTWHPVHSNILSSGGMDGSISHWCIDQADPTTPVVTLEAAHDSTVWALDYHPLGYVLASASKDYSTRFWCRARATGGQETDRWHVGDAASEAAGKPKWSQRVEEDDQGECLAVKRLV